MASTQVLAGLTVAVLLLWTVGAYNRLVRLRNAIAAAFAPVEQQFRLRQGLLQQWAQALAAAPAHAAVADAGTNAAAHPNAHADPGSAPASIEALTAAIAQAESAFAFARARPGAAGAITSLRLAEDIVAESRGRLPATRLADPALAELNAQLAATDSTLAFARRQFNDAVAQYNQAVRQFPTWLIAGLFSFGAAGTL